MKNRKAHAAKSRAQKENAAEKGMRKNVICLALNAMLSALCVFAEAQQPAKVPRIGYLAPNSLSVLAARVEAFRQGLRDLGYVEGKTIVIEWRSAEGKLDRLPALAAEPIDQSKIQSLY